eukprot:1038557-Pleurochrysis_carterae.AAC.2
MVFVAEPEIVNAHKAVCSHCGRATSRKWRYAMRETGDGIAVSWFCAGTSSKSQCRSKARKALAPVWKGETEFTTGGAAPVLGDAGRASHAAGSACAAADSACAAASSAPWPCGSPAAAARLPEGRPWAERQCGIKRQWESPAASAEAPSAKTSSSDSDSEAGTEELQRAGATRESEGGHTAENEQGWQVEALQAEMALADVDADADADVAEVTAVAREVLYIESPATGRHKIVRARPPPPPPLLKMLRAALASDSALLLSRAMLRAHAHGLPISSVLELKGPDFSVKCGAREEEAEAWRMAPQLASRFFRK